MPAYRWVLEHRLADEVEQLRQRMQERPLVLLDFATNADAADVSSPLSHAGLVQHYLEGTWPAGVTGG